MKVEMKEFVGSKRRNLKKREYSHITTRNTKKNKNEKQHARSLKLKNWIEKSNFELLSRLNLFRNLSEQLLRVFSWKKEFFLVEPIKWRKKHIHRYKD